MNALRFSHVAISCQKPRETERFYTRHFGFKRARVIPLGKDQIVFLKRDDIYLELFQASEAAPPRSGDGSGPAYPSWKHLAFQVDDIMAVLAQMGAEARVTLGPANFDDFIPGWRTVWIADPEGNIVEISQGFVDQENPPADSD